MMHPTLRSRGRSIAAALTCSAVVVGLLVGAGQGPAAALTPPVAVNDAYTTSTSSALIESAPGVLANDTDDGGTLTASNASDPPHGTVNLNSDGSFNYNADLGFVGTDTFTYTVSDGVDGSSTGTVTVTVFRDPAELLKDITPGPNQTTPIRAVDAGNGTAFFMGWGNVQNVAGLTPGKGIYKTDGTAAGTVLVMNLDIGSSNDSPITPGPVAIGGGKVVFYATDAANGREPWVSDGTPAGTFVLQDINPGSAGSSTNNFTAIGGGIALFTAFNPATGVELYQTDGTTAGTSMVLDINPGTVSGSPNCGALTFAGFFVWNSRAYFCATTAASGNELWTSDGTPGGTVMVKEIRTGTASASPIAFSAWNGLLWFQANDGTNGAELWNSDGTAANTNIFKDINLGSGSGSPGALNPLGSIAVFAATGSSATGSELWKTDGTPGGTSLVLDIRAGSTGSSIGNFAPVAGGLVFTANDGTTVGASPAQHGIEPWFTDGTAGGTQLLKDIRPGTTSSQPSSVTAFGGLVYMWAQTGTYGTELYRTDGTPAGTFLAQDIYPGATSAAGLDIRPALGTLLFEASEPAHGYELWHMAPPNTAPVAVNDAYATNEDTPLTVNAPGVAGNDSDAEFNVLHDAVKVSDPTNGSVTFNGDGSFTYTPAANYNGPDSFTYQSYDGMDYSNVATVDITVNPTADAPGAVDDTYGATEDTALTVNAPGVLGNDTDADGDTLTAAKVTDPAHGSVTVNGDGSFTYTPTANYNGPDSFTYKANDGSADSNVATVSLTVGAVNDAPVAVNDTHSTNEDTALTVNAPGVLGNDTDADADTLTAVQVTGPAHGTLGLNADGSFLYTPAADYNGPDSFTYKANDGSADSNVATVSLTVGAVNDPPVAVDDSHSTNEDTPLTVNAPGLLGNDTDADADTLTAVQVTGPAHGTLGLNADGSFLYTPAADYNGPDSFTYKANDGTADSNVATVSLTVGAVNDAPVAVDDSHSTNEDTALTVNAPGVLGNDTDADADTLTAVQVTGPAHGTLGLNADGSFLYTPTADYNGPDSFTYKANDGSADSNVATVSLTVGAVNDAPVAVNDSYVTDEALTVGAPGVLANDTDVEANPLTAVQVTGPAHGTLTLNADGSFLYTPTVGYSGPDSFTYKANDGSADSNVATVSLTVTTRGAVADFDGDGDTDVSVFRPFGGNWFVKDGLAVSWGNEDDIAVPADYDGDGTTDVAVFRPSTGTWYVKDGPTVAWGTDGDIPVPGDYDGDATADIAVFRPSTGIWYVEGGPTVAWGTNGDIAVPADYDGDGDADIAVFRPSTGTWYVQGGATTAWGTNGDIPVPADYDGDGDAEVAVFRPTTGAWYVNGGPIGAWGTNGDIPVPGDYNGDGDTEVAVFRPSNSTWYIQALPTVAWGTTGDVPLPLPYSALAT